MEDLQMEYNIIKTRTASDLHKEYGSGFSKKGFEAILEHIKEDNDNIEFDDLDNIGYAWAENKKEHFFYTYNVKNVKELGYVLTDVIDLGNGKLVCHE